MALTIMLTMFRSSGSLASIIFRYFALLSFFLALIGFSSHPTLAASLAPALNSSPQTQTQALDLAIDKFLESLPASYYAIRTPEALKHQLNNPNTILVDVREIKEYQAGHIPGAINIPLRTLGDNLEQIPRDSSIVVYCSTGYRSAMAVTVLHLSGYEKVQGFPPSFTGWQAAGEAIAKN